VIWIILIFVNGTVLLLFNQTLVGSVYSLPLPSPPLSAPVVLNNGTPVPAVLNGSVLEVPVLGRAVVTVKYVPRVATVGGTLSFNVSDGLYLIWAQGGVVLLPTVKILNYTKSGDAVLMVAEGPGAIAYAVQGTRTTAQTLGQPTKQAVNQTATQTTATPQMTQTASNVSAVQTTAHAATQTATTAASITQQATPYTTYASSTSTAVAGHASSSSSAATGQTSVAGGRAHPDVALALLFAAAAVVAIIAVLALRGRARSDLNDTDRMVLSYLRRVGGAYESEVARALGIPRTTVFKSVRRLERAGLVAVEKRGGRNFVAPK